MKVKDHAYNVLDLTSSSSDRGISIDETHLNRIALQVKKVLIKFRRTRITE